MEVGVSATCADDSSIDGGFIYSMLFGMTGSRCLCGQILAIILLLGFSDTRLSAEVLKFAKGDRLAVFEVGGKRYEDVVIKSVSARTVMFIHRGGMASVKLSDLPPQWQRGFGYDPQAEMASDRAQERHRRAREARLARQAAKRKAAQDALARSKFEKAFQAFGQPAILSKEGVDFRPRFRELGLYAKDQGRRPSCSVFAVVSAMEFIHAENTGKVDKFSEEYLIWATLKSINRPASANARTGADADTGFALTEVVTALRSYGVPLNSSMPNTIGRRTNIVNDPPEKVISEARERTQGSVHRVPGRDNPTRLNNIVQALNTGLPIAIGTGWPRFHNARAALLDTQNPSYSHAVTLVGYRSPTGRLEDTTFIFKNSWGPAWGANGYGYASYRYLVKHLHTAVLLEIKFSD